MPKLFSKNTRYWVHGGNVASAATTAMKAILNEAVGPHLEDVDKNADSPHVKDLFQSIENGLKFEFHQSWAQVINLQMWRRRKYSKCGCENRSAD